jgi:hypothetical protein
VSASVPAPVAAKKKTNPLVWILVGILSLILLVIVGLGLGAAYLAHKVKQNPALAFSSIVTRMNPDLEVLSSDSDKGTLTVRDKKTGKVVTMNFEDIKRGKFTIQEEGKDAVTMQAEGSGDTGSFEIKSGGQVARFGAGTDKVPSWVPTYPGAKVEGTFALQGADGQGGSFQLKTRDSVEKAMSYYESALKNAGFTLPTAEKTGEGGMIVAENNERSVHLTFGQQDGQTTIATIYGTKK